ncbi:MAG TPA: DMT family transporter, partial [Candidatus Binataceae bacterium]|nr:DMT family transporter [Candidatus Binataceae bacterium]
VHLDPLLFCAAVALVASACIIVLLRVRGELSLLFDRRFRGRLFLMSMTGTVLTSLTVTEGLTRISAIAGVLLLQSEPIYSILLATVFVGERPSARQLLATATILIGIGSVFGGGAFGPLWAAALVFATPLFWQISHVLGLRLMPPLGPATIAGGRFIYATIVLFALLLAARPATLAQLADVRALGVIAVTGTFVYFLSALTWYGAINRLSLAWTTALVIPSVPLLSIVFSVLFLSERATARELAGIVIAIAGVIWLVLGTDAHRHRPVEILEAVHEPLN